MKKILKILALIAIGVAVGREKIKNSFIKKTTGGCLSIVTNDKQATYVISNANAINVGRILRN